jgi:hypothetical protein
VPQALATSLAGGDRGSRNYPDTFGKPGDMHGPELRVYPRLASCSHSPLL